MIAFAAITGAQVDAWASFRLGDMKFVGGNIELDALTVRTKFAKTFQTFFMPVCDRALGTVTEWIGELERDHHWGPADILFPATKVGLAEGCGFAAQGPARHGWASTSPISARYSNGRSQGPICPFSTHQLPRHAGAPRDAVESRYHANEGMVSEPGSFRSNDDIHQLRCFASA